MIKRSLSKLNETVSKTEQKEVNEVKKKETLDDVKPVENIHKNHQSFQRMSNVKKKSLFHINYKTTHE